MDWTIVTSLSASCIFVGVGLTFAYGSTFLLTPYNEIHLSGQSGIDETDTPYTLAIIETVISALTVIIGTIAIYVPKKTDRNVITIALIYFIMVILTESVLVATRLTSLGIVGENVVGTCSDKGVSTGCPTTRFEDVHDRVQLYTNPLGGDCQFFYWDSMKTKAQNNSCQSQGPSPGFELICDTNIENHMNWANPSSYGWGDNPEAVMNLPSGSQVLTSVDKLHNPSFIKAHLQIEYEDQIITQMSNSSGPPAIAYCYYWGCSSVCNSHRYLINRQWLWSSVILLITHIVFALSSALLCRRAKAYKESYDKLPTVFAEVVAVKSDEFMIPQVGRRKRVLNGLKF